MSFFCYNKIEVVKIYNFKIAKERKEELLNNILFSNQEKEIFIELTNGTKRNELPTKLNISQRTVARRIKQISLKINEYENNNSNVIHKVYIHKFPNGKKYVGVCQCCEDRWANGNGYAYNTKMYSDIQKYGWENIEHKILLETSNSEIAYTIEKILIDELDLKNNGFNNQ